MYLPPHFAEALICQDCGTQPNCSDAPHSFSNAWYVIEGQDTSPDESNWIKFVCPACASFYQQSPLCRVALVSSYTRADLARLDDMQILVDLDARSLIRFYQEFLNDVREREYRYGVLRECIRWSANAPRLCTKTPRRARRPLSPRLRYTILQRDSFRCCTCGRTPEQHGVVLHVDHIVAVAKGGTNDPANLRALCAECNLGKGDR